MLIRQLTDSMTLVVELIYSRHSELACLPVDRVQNLFVRLSME
jgi:hypothetical protein